jgi:hypothetical protein
MVISSTRRVHRQRPKDLHHRCPRRRLHLAGLPHRSGRGETQGHIDPDRRHQDPGYSWTPIITSDGAHHTDASYYHDVRVPVDMLVGEENAGWRLITTQLNHGRVMLGPAGRVAGIYDRVHAWASRPGGKGGHPIDHGDVRRALGEIRAVWRINELLNWQVAAAGETIDVDLSLVFAAATTLLSAARCQPIQIGAADGVRASWMTLLAPLLSVTFSSAVHRLDGSYKALSPGVQLVFSNLPNFADFACSTW